MTTVVLLAFSVVFTIIFLHFGDIVLTKFHTDRISDIDIYAPEIRRRLQRHRAKAVFGLSLCISSLNINLEEKDFVKMFLWLKFRCKIYFSF